MFFEIVVALGGGVAAAPRGRGRGVRGSKKKRAGPNVAILDMDWRPEPPTPSSNALPWGWRRMRAIRKTCSIASRNITRGIGDLDSPLCSSR